MQECRSCPLPIFDNWHNTVTTANGIVYHEFCFYDVARVTPQVNLIGPERRGPRMHLPRTHLA